MRVAVDQEARDEVTRALDVDDIGLALRRFRFAEVREGQRITVERLREHAEREPREILFDRYHARGARGGALLRQLLRRRRRRTARAAASRRRHRPWPGVRRWNLDE